MPTKYLHPAYHYISTLLHPLMKLYHCVMCYTPYYPTYEKSLLQLGFTHCITSYMKNHYYSSRFYTPYYPTYEKSLLQLGFTHPITPNMKPYHFIMFYTLFPHI